MQAVDVDAVVGVAVGEHDRGEVLDRRRAPAGAPKVPLPQSIQIDVSPPTQQVAAARAAAGAAVRARAPEHGQFHDQPQCQGSTARPRDRGTARRASRKVSTVPTGQENVPSGHAPAPCASMFSLGQEVADLERGLVRARHQHDVPAHHVADRTGEQRVVRAPEHERVDVGVAHRRQQPLGEHVHLVGVDVARLDELDEAGHAAHVSSTSASIVPRRRAGTRPTRWCRRCRSRRPGRCG